MEMAAEGDTVSTSTPEASPQPQPPAPDLRCMKRMSRNKLALSSRTQQRSATDACSPDRGKSDKDAGSWNAESTVVLIRAFRNKRVAKLLHDGDWRFFRAEDWEAVTERVNNECGLTYGKDLKSAKQCKYKIFNLKRRYKSEKEIVAQRGGASDWVWFKEMDVLMNQHLSLKPEVGDVSRASFEEEQIHAIVAAVPTMHATSASQCCAGVNGYLKPDSCGSQGYCAPVNGCPKPDSCSSPASKSTSTINLNRGSEEDEGHGESGAASVRHEFLGDVNQHHYPLKKGCRDGVPARQFEEFQANISTLMSMMAQQQCEMIHLMRNVVTWKARQVQETTLVFSFLWPHISRARAF